MSDKTTLLDSFSVDTIENVLSNYCEQLKPSKKSLGIILQFAASYDVKMINNQKLEFLNN